MYLCYVLGCTDETTIGRLHQRFGRVDCCVSHDPDRHGVAIAFGKPAPETAPAAAKPSPAGGTKVPRPIPAPRFPSPGTAAKPF